jgi:hypothetical protein
VIRLGNDGSDAYLEIVLSLLPVCSKNLLRTVPLIPVEKIKMKMLDSPKTHPSSNKELEVEAFQN